jgi:BirA family biotin operon repressor/biotin-[acetyl-CoA-carboxylase] ligase
MDSLPVIIQPDSTSSTNMHIKELLKQQHLPECSVIITNRQTAGHGQAGNTWEAEPGKNLTFSIVFFPEMVPATSQFILSKTVAVAIVTALEKYFRPVEIKWPNDIYYHDQKLGGILIENALQGSSISQTIAGIGINVNQTSFPENIPNPISVKMITGFNMDLPTIFQQVYQSLTSTYQKLTENDTTEIERNYLSHLYRRTGFHKYRDSKGVFLARISNIGSAGHIFLTRPDGNTSRYAFKEVEFIF